MLLVLLMAAVCTGAMAEESGTWLTGVLERMNSDKEQSKGHGPARRAQQYVAMLWIDGEISAYDYYYNHYGTLEVLDELCNDENNVGLMLVFNTPGGGLYEADELLHAVEVYKAQTGRPVYAYMEQECCSAGLYAAMGAEYIMAARMTLTGSVGVYMESVSEAGLYQKLGIEDVYVSSGENKVTGYPTLTQSQREIYQSVVDESFDIFKDVIKTSRGLTEGQMVPFLDGRILTAYQAKAFGLIDAVMYYDEAVMHVLNQFDADVLLEDVTPYFEAYDEGADYGEAYTEGTPKDWVQQLVPEQDEGTGGAYPRKGGLRSRK